MQCVRTISLLTLTLCMVAITGCTAAVWYEGTQRSAVDYCHHLPPGDVDQCLKGVSKQSYEDYEKERTGQQ